MSEKHLKKGDQLPSLAKDTLRLYSMRYCPFAQRTRLVLVYKKIPHEVVNVNLKEKPDWFLERNPVGTVPTLEFNDKILWESAVCNDYLDEVYPDLQLNPKDPYERAKQRILLERWGKAVQGFYSVMRAPEDQDKKAELQKHLQLFEDELKDKLYFSGEKVGMLDYNIWGHMEKIHSAQVGGKLDMMGDYKTKYPRLAAYIDRMLEDPAVKATYTEPSVILKFYEGYMSGNVKYDDL